MLFTRVRYLNKRNIPQNHFKIIALYITSNSNECAKINDLNALSYKNNEINENKGDYIYNI